MMHDPVVAIDRFINELTVSVMLEESLGGMISDEGMSLTNMDVIRSQKLWSEILNQKSRFRALDFLMSRLASIKHERIVMRILWSIDFAIEKTMFAPREIAHSLVCSEHLRVESPILFRCIFKLLLKLIFFLDYKSNREVFNKSIEKSSQFTEKMFCDRNLFYTIDPSLELIQLLLCREICLMPAYFAMHELIRNFSSEFGDAPQFIQTEFNKFMDSFKRPARLLYSRVYHAMTPFCGITSLSAPNYRLDSSNLVLTSIKGAMRYPDFLTSSQLPLLCTVLGQLRSFELTTGMLDPASGKVKTRSVGLELALVELIVQVMELLECTNDEPWNRTIFEHLISVMITFMLNSTVRFNEIVVKLNSKLEGRTWTKSSHYVMWFVLNATSGFIGKNMLTDFVPCLRLFDILFPEAEDPDRAIDLPIPCCSRKDSTGQSNDSEISLTQKDGVLPKNILGKELSSTTENTKLSVSQFPISKKMDIDSSDLNRELVTYRDNENEVQEQSSTSAEDSDNECIQNETESLLPPHFRSSTACWKRQGRLLHLATAPVCLWQHVLRKSRLGQDHLPRVMPPALRPIESRISRRMQALVQSVSSTQISNSSVHLVSKLTWNQLFVVLNAFSTDNEVSQLIQRLIDIFWTNETAKDNQKLEHGVLWSRLIKNGKVDFPYDLSAYGRLQPLSHHLMRTMSVHVRMLVLHFFLQKFSVLPNSNMLSTPAIIETFCRILACREVESNNVNRILCLLTKLQPLWSYNTSNTEPKYAVLCGTTEPKVSNYFSCSLVFTLLDTLGFRLADILTPEVRIHTLTSLIGLVKLWSNWSTSVLDNKEPKNLCDGGTSEIPIELQYLLDWNIIKFARSIQAPDCVIYGFCSALTSSTLTQTQPGTNSLHSVNNSACVSQPQSSNIMSQQGSGLVNNTTSGSVSMIRPFIPVNTGVLTSISSSSIIQPPNDPILSSNTGVNSLTGGSGSTGFPNSIPGYPFLMCDNVEVNRFVLYSLLQMYHTFDLEEASGIRPNLVEQIRSMCEQCGPNSLIDLPQLITKRLPDFLILVIRQLTNPNTGELNIGSLPSSDPMNVESMESTLPYTDKSISLSKLCSMVQEEYTSFSNRNFEWSDAVSRSNMFLCLLFRYFMEYQNIPNKPISLLHHISVRFLNRQLRMLCDYIVSSLTFTAQVNFTTDKCLSTLSDFCIRWHVIPLDRFLLFLLMHTRYQHSQLLTVNRIIVYLFTQSDQITSGIMYLNKKYEANPNNSDSNTQRKSPHSDPLSSRDWFSCIRALHEIIPDQWITYPKTCTISCNTSNDSLEETDKPPHLPVSYGHLLLRLLPLLEVVIMQFLMCEVPFVLLIPFCRAIAPLFRYHRRPVNVCYTVLHDHAEFTMKGLLCKSNIGYPAYHLQLSDTKYLDTSPSSESDMDKTPWIVDRLLCQLLVHCIISKHQRLAMKAALNRSSKGFDQQHSSVNGIFTQQGWNNLLLCVKQSEVFYDVICRNLSNVSSDCNIVHDNTDQSVMNILLNPESFETQFRSMFMTWYSCNIFKYNWEYLFGLIDPICKSNQRHGIYGHSAAWRIWNYEESVCIQTAGLYAASIELMSSFMSPSELTSVVSDLLTNCAKHMYFNQLLNITGALAVILPSVYRFPLFKFCVTLFNDPILCDTTPESNPVDPESMFTCISDVKSTNDHNTNTKWRRSSRALRHRKLLDVNLTSVDNVTLASEATSFKDENSALLKPPKVALYFFEKYLPLDQKTDSDLVDILSNGGCSVIEMSHQNTEASKTLKENFNNLEFSSDVMEYLVKANLWHSIWAHANTSHLASLPGIFSDLILPELRTEAQLLMAFYLVAPLMGSLHSERPAKLVDLTAELYRAVWKVDTVLAKSNYEKSHHSEISIDISNSKQLGEHLPSETGVPLVHVDTIADLLYHIKYMYVGNGVLDQVRPLLPQLRPSLRKRLKFILPQDSSVSQQQQNQNGSHPIFENRVYRASIKPPMCNGDF
ncbi:unnamed protein product [Schistosoma rodhaini]|nr:unnamed protein product [Schistosoma rodhaini]